ncbi:MAG: 50S ribosomal protein L11 methyltransferase [Hydrotalea sp.]|nr:50S ribosomal protein L11 methyltransferase [Hydrotalea sp.]
MMYWKLTIEITQESDREEAMAALIQMDWESFEEEENTLHAYILEEKMKRTEVESYLNIKGWAHSFEQIEQQNWNALWESNFEPVIVDDFVGIRAHFHEPIIGVQYELQITPKMSFGTGHHATTHMMMQLMRSFNWVGKKVFDFGTGTGVLAILAEKLGATQVLATDCDTWCIENSEENAATNNCTQVRLQLLDHAGVDGEYDFILANINRHILLDNMEGLAKKLRTNGRLFISGFLPEDVQVLEEVYHKVGLAQEKLVQRDKWVAMILHHM